MQSTDSTRSETEAERSRRRYAEGAWDNAPHGSRSRYSKGGCRCDECRAAEAQRGREKYARRRANGGRPDPGTIENTCSTCGTPFTAKRKRTYCTRACYLTAIGHAPKPDYWVHNAVRLTIYHRDGYRCQLCGDPIDMCADTNAPLRANPRPHRAPSTRRRRHRGQPQARPPTVQRHPRVRPSRLPPDQALTHPQEALGSSPQAPRAFPCPQIPPPLIKSSSPHGDPTQPGGVSLSPRGSEGRFLPGGDRLCLGSRSVRIGPR